MKRLLVILGVLMLCAGCESLGPAAPALSPLDEADAKLGAQDYKGAIAGYDTFLKAAPQDPQAARVRATQTALTRLVATQTEVDRLRQAEGPRQRDLADRQNEVDRLKNEVAKLRADLERLRQIDLNELKQAPKK